MNALLWFTEISTGQLEIVVIGALVLIVALLFAYPKEPSVEDLLDGYGQPTFWERCEETARGFLQFLGSLSVLFLFFTLSWAYFSCCSDLWTRYCQWFGIPRLNLALIPALAIACYAFYRLTDLARFVLDLDSKKPEKTDSSDDSEEP